MYKDKIGIIGYGHVGKAMHNLFKDAIIYDKYIDEYRNNLQKINEHCYCVFICVPTPRCDNGRCDTSIVEEIIGIVKCDLIIIRSTVEVGFTKSMINKYKKEIVFQPEYYGETVAHPFIDLNDREWLSFGGTTDGISKAIAVYQKVMNANINIYYSDPNTVELAKYMENCFFAMKVSFCNEMYDIAQKLECNYDQAREIWTADPRIGKYHTFVYRDNRGFGGSCLPKDLDSLIYQCEQNKVNCDIIKAVKIKNKYLKSRK